MSIATLEQQIAKPSGKRVQSPRIPKRPASEAPPAPPPRPSLSPSLASHSIPASAPPAAPTPSPYSQGPPARHAYKPGAAMPSPAPPPSPKIATLPAEQQADAIDRTLVPSMLATAMGMDEYFTVKGFRAYLDKIRKEAGDPTDPIEVMLLEQLVVAHLRAAQLQGDAGQAQGLEATRTLNNAAARLLGEFRQTALALQSYRAGRRLPETKCAAEETRGSNEGPTTSGPQ